MSSWSRLTKLTTLYLGGNQLEKLPPEIGLLTELTHLQLDGNQLTELPPEIGNVVNLRILTLSIMSDSCTYMSSS